ncbi:MAG: hypothetical protein AAF488_02455 [Planctomycetota bacterium]
MAKFAKNYTVMEVRTLLEDSEGRGPGTGGHAISTHGAGRADVTDRNKPKDSAFKISEPVNFATGKSMVHLADQALAVCNALNSEKGQAALRKLDGKDDTGKFQTAFTADLSLANLNPHVRAGSGSTATLQKFSKLYVEPWKLDGVLHIHTAYSK